MQFLFYSSNRYSFSLRNFIPDLFTAWCTRVQTRLTSCLPNKAHPRKPEPVNIIAQFSCQSSPALAITIPTNRRKFASELPRAVPHLSIFSVPPIVASSSERQDLLSQSAYFRECTLERYPRSPSNHGQLVGHSIPQSSGAGAGRGSWPAPTGKPSCVWRLRTI